MDTGEEQALGTPAPEAGGRSRAAREETVSMHACMHIYACAYVHAYACAYVHAYACAYVQDGGG